MLFENSNPLTNRNEKGLFYSVSPEKFQIIFLFLIWTVKNNQKKLITDAVKFPDFLSIYEEVNIMTLRINEWKEVCMMAEKRCYTVAELQEILGVSRPTVYSLLKRNEFRWIQLDGGKYRISRKVLTTGWINSLLKNNFPMEKVHRHSNAIFIFPLFFQQEGRIDYE